LAARTASSIIRNMNVMTGAVLGLGGAVDWRVYGDARCDTRGRRGAPEPWAGDIRALGVERLALFGSVSRGRPRPDSDADVLVSFAAGKKTYGRFLELAELLEDALGRPVELVTVESLSPILGPKILAEARDVLRAA
jgi:uncharacterized protein